MERRGIDLPGVVTAYAGRMHREVGSTHHVASPLGAWIVLALAASAGDADGLADALGCSRAEAVAAARDVLARPHPVLALAAAIWQGTHSPALDDWVTGLGDHVENGPIPTQADADGWAARNTLGLIDRFPVTITPRTLLVLASAVAASIEWRAPFGPASPALPRLPRAAGFEGIALLRSPGLVAMRFITMSEIGAVAVHAMPSADGGLLVVSVIAEESVVAADVLAVAHPIAVALARDEAVPGRHSLFDLDTGSGHAWTITETEGTGARDVERYECLLPAWHASSDHDLTAMASLGFAAAGDALRRIVGGGDTDARQSALARYTRAGFAAAAVTGMAMRSAAMVQQRQVRVRTAQLEFTRAHAAVAVAVDEPGSPWSALPVFSAWVTAGDEPG